jgi:hypothetical protein
MHFQHLSTHSLPIAAVTHGAFQTQGLWNFRLNSESDRELLGRKLVNHLFPYRFNPPAFNILMKSGFSLTLPKLDDMLYVCKDG